MFESSTRSSLSDELRTIDPVISFVPVKPSPLCSYECVIQNNTTTDLRSGFTLIRTNERQKKKVLLLVQISKYSQIKKHFVGRDGFDCPLFKDVSLLELSALSNGVSIRRGLCIKSFCAASSWRCRWRLMDEERSCGSIYQGLALTCDASQQHTAALAYNHTTG